MQITPSYAKHFTIYKWFHNNRVSIPASGGWGLLDTSQWMGKTQPEMPFAAFSLDFHLAWNFHHQAHKWVAEISPLWLGMGLQKRTMSRRARERHGGWTGVWLKNWGSPGCYGLVDWATACEPKGHWFDSQSGHMPGLWARALFGDMWEATDWCISHTLMFLSLSFSLPSPLSK